MIKIICHGKIKEKYMDELIKDYQKRISRYHKIEIIELKDYDNLEQEKTIIEKNIGNQDYVVAMDIDGKIFKSEDLAEFMDTTFLHHSTITFIIGSSYGLHQDIKDRADLRLSFSKLTFPHGLFRGILLEQIYRAFKILNNESYHK